LSLDGQVKLSAHLQVIAEVLGEQLNEIAGEKVLFALHIFGEGDDKRAQYVSNANRPDVAKALTELLEHWKATGGRDDGPYHVFRSKLN
jgi:hypothetical protein